MFTAGTGFSGGFVCYRVLSTQQSIKTENEWFNKCTYSESHTQIGFTLLLFLIYITENRWFWE